MTSQSRTERLDPRSPPYLQIWSSRRRRRWGDRDEEQEIRQQEEGNRQGCWLLFRDSDARWLCVFSI